VLAEQNADQTLTIKRAEDDRGKKTLFIVPWVDLETAKDLLDFGDA
jgi:hypothetical protein